MMLYFQKINSSLSASEKTFVILGDSIAKGTSNGVGNTNDNVLFEYDGINFLEIENDILGANTGSWIPSFANTLSGLTGSKIYVSTNGSPGSEFAPHLDDNNWSSTGTQYSTMKSEALNIQTIKPIDGFIIILGINDARGSTSVAQITIDAFDLIDRLNDDFNNPNIYIVQIGRTESGVTSKVLQVRDIITNGVDGLVETYSNVSLCASLATFDNAYFYDNLHLSQSGNDILGEQIANFISL